MLLHDARRDARIDEAGDLVILEEQDRSRWDQRQIAEALPLVNEAFRGGPSPFALQAAIAAVHCQAVRAEDTDWPADRAPLRSSRACATFSDCVAEPRRGGGDGGRPSNRARAWWMPLPPATISTTITFCMPSAPICCAALAPQRKRRRVMSARSRWSPMTASGGFWSGGCEKSSHRQREPESRLPTRAAAPPSGQPAWRATPPSTPALPTPGTSGTRPRDGCI